MFMFKGKVVNMKFTKHKTNLIFLAIAFILMSCGGSTYEEKRGSNQDTSYKSPNFNDGLNSLPPIDEDTSGGGSAPPATPEVPVGLKEPYIEKEVRAVGYTSTSFNVSARNILKIQFEPQTQDRTAGGTGFSPAYSKMAVYIEVNGQQKPTPLLRNGLMGTQQKSSIIDMSAHIPKTCAASDLNCRENVKITITRPNYDYWCFNFGGVYCQQTHTYVYQTHPWRGMVYVQTDDTDPLE